MIYGSKHGKYWFSHIFLCNFTTMASTEVKLWFLSSVEHFWTDLQDTLSKFGLFFEKMHKVFENKVQRCSTPLTEFHVQVVFGGFEARTVNEKLFPQCFTLGYVRFPCHFMSVVVLNMVYCSTQFTVDMLSPSSSFGSVMGIPKINT